MTKSDLRKTFLARRMSLSASEIFELSGKIFDRFFNSIPLSGVRILHIYRSISKFNEVATEDLIDRLRLERNSILIACPRINPEHSTLEHLIIDESAPMIKNSWGISEPAGSDLVDPTEIDLVIVPLLAFDLRGFRVGYGKGFYDKFLAQCRPDCLKVGLSFFPPVEEISGIHEMDIALDCCVTPDRVFYFE